MIGKRMSVLMMNAEMTVMSIMMRSLIKLWMEVNMEIVIITSITRQIKI